MNQFIIYSENSENVLHNFTQSKVTSSNCKQQSKNLQDIQFNLKRMFHFRLTNHLKDPQNYCWLTFCRLTKRWPSLINCFSSTLEAPLSTIDRKLARFNTNNQQHDVVKLILFVVVYLCPSRYRHVDLCPADVCEDGHFPGDAVQAVWKTLQGGSLL